MHICIFFFCGEWLSSNDLHIGDCGFFLGYHGNLSFTYVLTTGNLVQPIRCQSINVIHHKLNPQASDRSQVTEDDDHCTMLRRSKRRKLQASDNEFLGVNTADTSSTDKSHMKKPTQERMSTPETKSLSGGCSTATASSRNVSCTPAYLSDNEFSGVNLLNTSISGASASKISPVEKSSTPAKNISHIGIQTARREKDKDRQEASRKTFSKSIAVKKNDYTGGNKIFLSRTGSVTKLAQSSTF